MADDIGADVGALRSVFRDDVTAQVVVLDSIARKSRSGERARPRIENLGRNSASHEKARLIISLVRDQELGAREASTGHVSGTPVLSSPWGGSPVCTRC
jgi:hypothetical protein